MELGQGIVMGKYKYDKLALKKSGWFYLWWLANLPNSMPHGPHNQLNMLCDNEWYAENPQWI